MFKTLMDHCLTIFTFIGRLSCLLLLCSSFAQAMSSEEWQRYEDLVYQSPPDAVRELATALNERQHDAESFAFLSALLTDAYSGIRNWDEAERVARLALTRLPDTPSEARAHLLTGLAYTLLSRSQYAEARELYGSAITYAEMASNADIGAEAHMGMANLLSTLEQNEGALEHIRIAHDFARESGDSRLLAAVTNEMATIYSYMARHQTAIKYYLQAYELSATHGDPVEMAVSLYNLASAYQADEQYQNAIANFELSFEAAQTVGLKEDMAYAQMGLANGWLALKRYSKAERAFLKAERMLSDTGDPAFEVQLYMTGTEISLGLAKVEQADVRIQHVLTVLNKHNDLEQTWMSQQSQRLNANVLAARGSYTEAYLKLNQYVEQLREFYHTEQRRREALLRVAFDVDRQALENVLLEQETELRQLALEQSQASERRWFIWSAVFLVMSLALAVSLYWQWLAHTKLKRITNTDPLTQLFNRRYMLNTLGKWLKPKGMRLPSVFSLVEFELQGFGVLTDRYGHQLADDLLVQIAAAEKQVLRGNDLFGRIGGERFLILLPDTDDVRAWRACERMREAIVHVFSSRIEDLDFLSCRFGVATFTGDDSSVEQLLLRAHESMLRDLPKKSDPALDEAGELAADLP
ncbi:diguanylate cyclase [Corallincola luteus]|uniref:diguanylate cyclase n=1 Tax=Corallincola luteus TaxID=1775177 RepID=A0ABY2ANY4_9GAMM|nr:diguanylate cyclase [Corallincola luteus]